MPRKKKSEQPAVESPVAEMPPSQEAARETALAIVQQFADSTHLPLTTGDKLGSAELVARAVDHTRLPDTSFDVSSFEALKPERQPGEDDQPDGPPDRWARFSQRTAAKRIAGARDEAQGIRVDRESEPAPGKPFARVCVTFSDDAKPNFEERLSLKREGFVFDDPSWTRRASAESYECALRLVNAIKKGRGETEPSRGFYI